MIVVGGGAIGVCSALELARRGARVTLLERGPKLASGCSAGNAGLICPSHSAPISNPASLRNGLRWMWKRDSPFYLRPRPAVLPWLARFALAARHAEEGTRVIRALSNESLELHAQLGEELDTSFERTGTLNVYSTEESLRKGAAEAEHSGLRFDVLDAAATHEAEPSLTGPVAGAVRYPDEARVDPELFVEAVGRAAVAAGVEIRTGVEVRSLDELTRGRRRGRGRRLVAAARPPPARGRQGLPRRLRALARRSAAADVAAGDVDDRDTTAEPAPPVGDARARRARPLDLAAAGRRDPPRRRPVVPGPRAAGPPLETWAGLRPCLPDGLPAIGWLGRTLVATGHAMKGVSLAPVTGRLVAQLAAGETPAHDLAPLDPGRF